MDSKSQYPCLKKFSLKISGPEYQKISDNIFSAFIKAKRVIQVHPPVKI